MYFFLIATVFDIVERKNYRAMPSKMPSKTKVVDELESGNRQQLKKIHRFWSIPIKALVLLVLPGISPLANFMLDTY